MGLGRQRLPVVLTDGLTRATITDSCITDRSHRRDLIPLIVATARAKPQIFAERGSSERSVLSIQVRMSSDRPILNAFCRVAPSVRFSLLAMRDAPFFWRAIVLKVRTCSAVHALRFLAFLAIEQLPVST